MDGITLKELQDVHKNLKKHPNMFFETPLLSHVEQQLKKELPSVKSLSLKLESMQCTGSFKARGVLNQFLSLKPADREKTLVTMSAGNYGKAFAYVASIEKLPALVFMPETAPIDRKHMIESLGANVILCPRNQLLTNVEKHTEENGSLFLHSFDDPVLLKGNASAGLELANQISEQPDIVVVCCGGGGFLAGVALALKLLGWTSTKIYGVEPEAAPTMYEALQAGKVVHTEVRNTIAAGLAPPFAGKHCFEVIQRHVEDVILVSDDEIRKAVSCLFKLGLVVEPSGAAAFAALLHNKVPDTTNKTVIVYLTGGNISPEDLTKHINEAKK